MKTAKVTKADWAERVADGRSHEGRGAGRGHHNRQHAGEEAAGVALLLRKRAARAGQREADLELPGQREAEEEEQPGHQRQKDRRLELESPAERGSRRAQAEQHSDQRPEGDENSRGIDQPMRAQLVSFFIAGVDQREALQEEHRKDAGHEVEQQGRRGKRGRRSAAAATRKVMAQ